MRYYITFLLTTLLLMGCHSLFSENSNSQWNGKKVAYLGDSITDPNHRAATKKYWSWLDEWLGTESYVYAVSGRRWSDIPRQADKLMAEHGQDVDAIIVFVGTNDFNGGVVIGEWYEVVDTVVMAANKETQGLTNRKKRHILYDPETYKGRINIALAKLKHDYPTKQIILLTPIHRGYAMFSETNIQPSEEYANSCGEFFDAYVAAVKEAGNIWAVPVVDLNSLCGLYPLDPNHSDYFYDKETDRLHPNNKGHERIATTLLYQLNKL